MVYILQSNTKTRDTCNSVILFYGNVTGIGEYVLTYNPITVTNSTFESLWKDLLYLGAGGAILLVVVLIIVFAGPMLLSLMFQNIKEK